MLPGTYFPSWPMNMIRQASGTDSLDPRSASISRQTMRLPMSPQRQRANASTTTGTDSRWTSCQRVPAWRSRARPRSTSTTARKPTRTALDLIRRTSELSQRGSAAPAAAPVGAGDGPAPAGPPSADETGDGPASAGPAPADATGDGPPSAAPAPAGETGAGPTSAAPAPADATGDGPASAGPAPAGETGDGPASAGPAPADATGDGPAGAANGLGRS